MHTLNLSGCATLTDKTYAALAKHCPELKHLDASGMGDKVTAGALASIAGRLESASLDHLSLSPARGGVRGATTYVASALTGRLKRLSIAALPWLGNDVLPAVAAACASLTSLNVSESAKHDSVAKFPWLALMTGCPLIESLRRVPSHAGPHTIPLARSTPILKKDFRRWRLSPSTPRSQSPPATPFDSTK